MLTTAERSFFYALGQALQGRFIIFAKVRLADVIEVKKGASDWQRHFNRIQSKHLDFLICDPATVCPLVAIELDDSSHRQSRRFDRDAFVDEAMKATGIALWRPSVRQAYSVLEIQRQIAARIPKAG